MPIFSLLNFLIQKSPILDTFFGTNEKDRLPIILLDFALLTSRTGTVLIFIPTSLKMLQIESETSISFNLDCGFHYSIISDSSNPIMAAIPPSFCGTASCINFALMETSLKASSNKISSLAPTLET